MLIIEGADLVGKTTLAKACLKILNDAGESHMMAHLSRPPKSFDGYRGYLDRLATCTVWDRFHLSELAYRACDDYPMCTTPLKYELVDAAIRQRGGYVVCVIGDNNVIADRYAECSDDMYGLEHIKRVNEVFENMYKMDPWFSVRGQDFRYHVDEWLLTVDPAERAAEIVHRYHMRLTEFRKL